MTLDSYSNTVTLDATHIKINIAHHINLYWAGPVHKPTEVSNFLYRYILVVSFVIIFLHSILLHALIYVNMKIQMS